MKHVCAPGSSKLEDVQEAREAGVLGDAVLGGALAQGRGRGARGGCSDPPSPAPALLLTSSRTSCQRTALCSSRGRLGRNASMRPAASGRTRNCRSAPRDQHSTACVHVGSRMRTCRNTGQQSKPARAPPRLVQRCYEGCDGLVDTAQAPALERRGGPTSRPLEARSCATARLASPAPPRAPPAPRVCEGEGRGGGPTHARTYAHTRARPSPPWRARPAPAAAPGAPPPRPPAPSAAQGGESTGAAGQRETHEGGAGGLERLGLGRVRRLGARLLLLPPRQLLPAVPPRHLRLERLQAALRRAGGGQSAQRTRTLSGPPHPGLLELAPPISLVPPSLSLGPPSP